MLDAIGLELAKKKNIDMFIRNFFHNFFQTELSIKFAMSDSTEIEAEYEKFAKQREQGEKTYTQEIMMSIDMEEEESSLPEGDLKLVMGIDIKEVPTPLKNIQEEEKKITVQGTVFGLDVKELRNGNTLFTFNITDFTDSLSYEGFCQNQR